MAILPDVLGPDLRVVFCGTAVSTASARRGAYYAGPGNRFWPTLYRVGLTPRLLEPEEYGSMGRYRLGLTDLAKSVSGADASLLRSDFDTARLRAAIESCRPRLLAFTSKRAAREFLGHDVDYGLLPDAIGDTRLFVLTSPSGAARGHWSEEPWFALAELARPG